MRLLDCFPADVENFVFLGEAGCGKSELAVNLAAALSVQGRAVDLFDLDMTKPLFRSRDQAATLEKMGVSFHFQEQFADAPTTSGGVRISLLDGSRFTILDVGGDYIGARAIGGYAPLLNRSNTAVYYIVNSYRPWSTTLEHIDAVLAQTLGVSHVQLERLRLVANPNLGAGTSADEVIEGYRRLREMVRPYKPLDFLCCEESLLQSVQEQTDIPIFPLKRYLEYPWNTGIS